MTIDQLKHKKIAFTGLGINHQGLAEYFRKHEVPFEVIESWNHPDELFAKLQNFEMIFRTPGLPFLSPAIQRLREEGVEIYSQTKLFFDLCPGHIIAVTGTKGKGTTSNLIFEILQTAGKRVWFAGNVGKDPFEFLDQMTSQDWAVLELSSFQTQDLHKSPRIAVILNVTEDHVDPSATRATHFSQEEYEQAKAQLIAHQQEEDDVAFLHPAVAHAFKDVGHGKKITLDFSIADGFQTKLLGAHNKENIAAAVAVARHLGIADGLIQKAVADFEPLPHRLNIVADIDGVVFVDDSVSTNLDSTIAAMDSFVAPIILIVGGSDKGHDYRRLGEEILKREHIKALIVVGQVAPKILQAIEGFRGTVVTDLKDMREIVVEAKKLAKTGDVVLLSPAAASFDMFKDAKDRGDQFIAEVKNG